MKISCIGTGAMGGAIIRSICKKVDPKLITVTDKNTGMGQMFATDTGCNFVSSNLEVLDADYIFIAVKPQFLPDVFSEIADSIPQDSVVISMAAGVTLKKLREYAPNTLFIRMMPNVCAHIGQAMTAITYDDILINEKEANDVRMLLSCAGKVEFVPEKLMDTVTAVSGSGPAFVFMFIEAMADAAVKCGMPRSQAYTYAAQTVYGSAGMVLETNKHPAELKDMVCSPSGTTIEGVAALEENGFRSAVISAVTKAYEKSQKLGK